MSAKAIAYLKLILVIMVWGGIYHVAKYLVRDTDVATVSFIRFFFASLCLMIFYVKKKRCLEVKKSVSYWLILFFVGFFGIFIYTLLFFGAEKLISADEVAILYALTPCLTAFFGFIVFKQRIRSIGYVGIVIALIGTIGVLSLSSPKCGRFYCQSLFSSLSLGQIMALLAASSMAIYSVINKKATLMRIDSLAITTFGVLFGTVLLFINFLFFGGKITTLLHKPLSFWLAIFYASVFATAIGYKWYSDAIRELGVDQTTVFLNGVPFSAILIGLVITGQGVSFYELIAGIIVVLGVVLTNYSAKECN